MQGEKPIKNFFEKFKNKKENKPIRSLKNEEGVKCEDFNEILRIAEGYYKQLFSKREAQQPMMHMFLNNISPLEDCTEMMDGLTKPFSHKEIWEAISTFKADRSPGPDGISAEFYKVTFEIIKDELRRVLNSFLERRIPAKLKAGLISLIYQKKLHLMK